jgi:hypothetical protein
VEAVVGTQYLFEADIVFDDLATGLPPSTSTQKIYLWAKMGGGVPVLVEGGRIEISMAALQQRIKMRGSVFIEELTGIIKLSLGVNQVEIMSAADKVTAASILHNAELPVGTAAYLAVPAGEATTIEFYLLCNSTVTDFALCGITTHMIIYSGEVTSGAFV